MTETLGGPAERTNAERRVSAPTLATVVGEGSVGGAPSREAAAHGKSSPRRYADLCWVC